jgi:hypothetical protein
MHARRGSVAGVSGRLIASLLAAVVALLIAFALAASAHTSAVHGAVVHAIRGGTQVVSGYDGGVPEAPASSARPGTLHP